MNKEKKEGISNRGNRKNPSNKAKIMKYSEGKGLDNYRFNYNISINQYAVLKNNWELDYIDIAVFLSIYTFISSGKADSYRMIDANSISWYFVSENKIIKDLPLIPINSSTAITKRITNLCKYNLLVRNPDNRVNSKKHIRIGSGAKKYFYNYGNSQESPDIT